MSKLRKKNAGWHAASKDCQLSHQRVVLEKAGPSLYVCILLVQKMNVNLKIKCMNNRFHDSIIKEPLMRELSGLYLEYVCGEHPGKEFIYRIFRQFMEVLINLFICKYDL